MKNYQKKQTVVHLQKAYAEINQAFQMAQADHGLMQNWVAPPGNGDLAFNKTVFETYLAPYLKITKTCYPSSDECFKMPILALNGTNYKSAHDSTRIAFVTANGYSAISWGSDITSTFPFHTQIMLDIDGPNKGKNLMGRDIFQISVNFNNGKIFFFNAPTFSTEPLSRDDLTNSANSYACNKNAPYAGTMCGALIQLDGWQIKDDYPW